MIFGKLHNLSELYIFISKKEISSFVVRIKQDEVDAQEILISFPSPLSKRELRRQERKKFENLWSHKHVIRPGPQLLAPACTIACF